MLCNQRIQRASRTPRSYLQHMRVNRRCAHITVAQQLLHRANVCPDCSKCVAKLWRRVCTDTGLTIPANGTAISNERIRSISEHEVAFSVRADDHGGKRLVRLDGAEFVRRFMLHILPSGIKRIRHYGVLASSCKAVKLTTARAALHMPALDLRALECAQAFTWRG